ncbi:MAG: hypothetical protein H6629_15700 [Calditrichae bacterium]|nr:hypothetical protein [Calditrichia bacterium]
MSYENELIKKNKAKANLEAMKQMTESERRMFPPLSFFIEDYNKIRKLALQTNPSLEGIFPPEIKIAADYADTDISYSVLQAYTDQIASLIQKG